MYERITLVTPVSLSNRHEAVAPRWLAAVGDIARRGAWDDRLVDALCEPPETFVLGVVVAHVLTFSAHRHLLVRHLLCAARRRHRHRGPAGSLGGIDDPHVYDTATTLDGFIAAEDHSLAWLLSRQNDPNGPFGYKDFEKSIGALAMGANTYRWIRSARRVRESRSERDQRARRPLRRCWHRVADGVVAEAVRRSHPGGRHDLSEHVDRLDQPHRCPHANSLMRERPGS